MSQSSRFVLYTALAFGIALGLPGLAMLASLPERQPKTDAEQLLPQETLPPFSVESRLDQFGDAARTRLEPAFAAAGLPYPSDELLIVGLKRERRLELYGRAAEGAYRYLKSYDFAAWTGRLGPKLREGDLQIPEGLYGIDYLNPNSIAHVSLRIGYPNAFERARGEEEGRADLGGDIMIHGKTFGSQGCVVVEDAEVEEIFTLAADLGHTNVRVLLSPYDLRHLPPEIPEGAPAWTGAVYGDLIEAMADLPLPEAAVAAD